MASSQSLLPQTVPVMRIGLDRNICATNNSWFRRRRCARWMKPAIKPIVTLSSSNVRISKSWCVRNRSGRVGQQHPVVQPGPVQSVHFPSPCVPRVWKYSKSVHLYSFTFTPISVIAATTPAGYCNRRPSELSTLIPDSSSGRLASFG